MSQLTGQAQGSRPLAQGGWFLTDLLSNTLSPHPKSPRGLESGKGVSGKEGLHGEETGSFTRVPRQPPSPVRMQTPSSKKMLPGALEGAQKHGVLGSLPNPEFAPQAEAGEKRREVNIWGNQHPSPVAGRCSSGCGSPEAACSSCLLPVPSAPACS